ncbi:MAG: hypothetical protein Fur0015_04540 [Ignavibacteriales bacterium]
MKKLIILFGFIISSTFSQSISWQEITSQYQMPLGVKVFKGTRTSPKLQAFYIDVDLNNKNLAIRPYIGTSANLKTFTKNVGAYAAVNGGFFGSGVSFSTVIYPNEVKSQNVASLVRNSKSYPVIRSLFSMKKDGNFSIDWIYHFGTTINDIYKFEQPLNYIENDPNPKPAPQKSDGIFFNDILIGIGGAPRLVKNGEIHITYNEEVMWGSGVGLDNNDPRTAVGFTSDKHVILFTADGRQPAISEGVSLTELASILISLGCVEAMNLDGGGSTQMAIPDQYINSPSEVRAVPTILAVVNSDSLNIPKIAVFEKIIDTGDPDAIPHGSGWFPTANSGFYGTTASLLNIKGDGSNFYEFKPNLKGYAEYEVYGWWVASSNRCSDTPFIINHASGTDTVRINQQINGSSWQLIGKYNFGISENENVIISNAATTGTYVVADAVRFLSYDSSSVVSVEELDNSQPSDFVLYQNYPNPFNPETMISYKLPESNWVSIKIYDVLGNEVKTLLNAKQSSGNHYIIFDASNLSSGIYFYQLRSVNSILTRKMLLIR